MQAQIDLSNCDREQVQYPGAIQPHGALLVLDAATLCIVQASANSADYLGLPPAGLLGQGIASALGAAVAADLRERLSAEQLSTSFTRLLAVQPPGCGQACHLFASRTDDGLVLLELERLDEAARVGAPELYPGVHLTLQRLQSAPTLAAFFDLTVAEIRAMTGFDRVMAYRFAADGSGEVIAESVRAGLETYLGLHYPAADVPEPARRLFSLTWLRHLPDVDYAPVPLVPEHNPLTGAPVDLSRSFLRSVSEMYTGYLRNMGVKATLVTTLLKDGELWGLISCMHHAGPKLLPYEPRVAVECLAHMVSLLMAGKDAEEHGGYRHALGAARARLLDALLETDALHAALIDMRPEALTALDADGVALLADGRLSLLGKTPAEPEVMALASWLAGRSELTFVTHALAADYPPAAAFQAAASGLLAVRWSPGAPDGLMWFRQEWLQVVHWAGDPTKPVEIDASGAEVRLLPRTSFALWREAVAGESRRWLGCELEHATELRRGIAELLLRHTEQLRRMNRELAASNQELDTFAYAASHDLKEPLRGIHTSVEFLEEDDGARLSAEGRERLATILRLTTRMDALIESLLQYSRVGRIDLQLQQADLNLVVAQVLESFGPLAARGATVSLPDRLPVLECDPVRVGEVFSNLISNALKYNDKADKQIEIGCDGAQTPPVLFVRDNGIGIAEKHYARIFQIFRRLHGRNDFGGGAGAGLTIAKKAIERHGGRIWVESAPGQGSVFLFTLAAPR